MWSAVSHLSLFKRLKEREFSRTILERISKVLGVLYQVHNGSDIIHCPCISLVSGLPVPVGVGDFEKMYHSQHSTDIHAPNIIFSSTFTSIM